MWTGRGSIDKDLCALGLGPRIAGLARTGVLLVKSRDEQVHSRNGMAEQSCFRPPFSYNQGPHSW
jgi:hypothetical protein